MQQQNCKLALSLHEMLQGSDQQIQQSAAPALSSSEDSEDDNASVLTKKHFQPYHATSVPKSENLEAHANERAAKGMIVTTMMLRNIPNKYTQNTLMQEINDFGYAGTYDFFYLPMDVHNRSNVGYAFINFTTNADADRFHRAFADHRFQRFHSRKIGSVCVAHVQGLDANLRHFENRAVTQARNDQYRPVVLQGQVRVDFEEAVAAAKSRANIGPLISPQVPQQPQAGHGGAYGRAPQGPRHLQQQIRRHNKQMQQQPKQEAWTLPGACNADPVTIPFKRTVTPEEQAREGLEAAIRDLLAARGQPQAQQTLRSDAHPGSLEGSSAAEVGVGGPPDIAHLLSLRSLLVDRLLEKSEAPSEHAVAPPPGLGNSAEAYVNFKSNLSPNKKLANPYEFFDNLYAEEFETPRTNGLFLGHNLNSLAPNDLWHSL